MHHRLRTTAPQEGIREHWAETEMAIGQQLPETASARSLVKQIGLGAAKKCCR
jgi:hypothetical protein